MTTHLMKQLIPGGRTHSRLRTAAFAPRRTAARRMAAACLSLCLLLALLPTGALASGGATPISEAAELADGSTYTVSTPGELTKLAELTAKSDGSGASILLTDDITAPADTYLGTGTGGFAAAFDGGGNTITLSNTEGGLFRSVGKGGTVQNLVIAGDVSKRDSIVGGLADQCSGGTIESCANTADVSTSARIAGGIAGELGSGASVQSCYNTGMISGALGNVGGIAGNAFGGSTVRNCYNTGEISAQSKVGGIVGNNDSSAVQYCYNAGAVVGESYIIGGIVGEHYATAAMTNCLSLGPKVEAASENVSSIGRVAGEILDGATITGAAARADMKLIVHGAQQDITEAGADTGHGESLDPGEISWDTWLDDSDVWHNPSGATGVGGALPTLMNAPGEQSPALPDTLEKNCSVTADGGTVYYATLQDALESADGGTVSIKVEQSFTNHLEFHTGAASVTLDLNGKVLTCPRVGSEAGGSLTLTGGGTLNSGIMQTGGSLTVENSTVSGIIYLAGGSIAVDGGTVGLLVVYDSADAVSISGGTFRGQTLLDVSMGLAYLAMGEDSAPAVAGLNTILASCGISPSAEIRAIEASVSGAPCRIAYIPGPISAAEPTVSTGPATYRPTISESEHGTVKASPAAPFKGQKVTVTATAVEGYVVDTVNVTDRSGSAVEVFPAGDGRFTFIQPAGKVTITVAFRPVQPTALFADVEPADWFYAGVAGLCQHGLIEADPAVSFSPLNDATRAAAVSLLWTLEGCPSAQGDAAFTDVPPDARDALAWAGEQSLITGYADGRSGGGDSVTREQLAVLLYRYAGLRGEETPTEGMAIGNFADNTQVSPWARDAVCWCLGQGILNGRGGGILAPQAAAARAELAVMLQRYLELPRM